MVASATIASVPSVTVWDPRWVISAAGTRVSAAAALSPAIAAGQRTQPQMVGRVASDPTVLRTVDGLAAAGEVALPAISQGTAQFAELAGLLPEPTGLGWPAATRVIARRERPRPNAPQRPHRGPGSLGVAMTHRSRGLQTWHQPWGALNVAGNAVGRTTLASWISPMVS